MAGQGDGVGRGGGGAVLGHTSQGSAQYRPRLESGKLPVVGLQGPGYQAADDAV